MANLAVVSVATSTLSNCAKANVNGDNAVDALDTAYVQSQLGCAVGSGNASCDKSDVNNNGKVDNFDVLTIKGQFGCRVNQPLATNYTLTVNVSGLGTIISTNEYIGDIICGNGATACSHSYPQQSPAAYVVMEGTPAPGYIYTGFQVTDGGSCPGGPGGCGVSMTSNKEGAATFTTAPTIPKATNIIPSRDNTAGINVTWDAPAGAIQYTVYRCPTITYCDRGIGSAFGATPSYFDEPAVGVEYYYGIQAYNPSSGWSEMAVSATTGIRLPSISPVTNIVPSRNRTDGINITWDASPGATHYDIYRCTTISPASCSITVGGTSLTSILVEFSIDPGEEYYYGVDAYSPSGGWSGIAVGQ